MATVIKLDPDVEALIDDLVESGAFSDREAAVNASLRQMHPSPDRLPSHVLASIEVGLADIDAGRVHSVEEVREYFSRRRASQA